MRLRSEAEVGVIAVEQVAVAVIALRVARHDRKIGAQQIEAFVDERSVGLAVHPDQLREGIADPFPVFAKQNDDAREGSELKPSLNGYQTIAQSFRMVLDIFFARHLGFRRPSSRERGHEDRYALSCESLFSGLDDAPHTVRGLRLPFHAGDEIARCPLNGRCDDGGQRIRGRQLHARGRAVVIADQQMIALGPDGGVGNDVIQPLAGLEVKLPRMGQVRIEQLPEEQRRAALVQKVEPQHVVERGHKGPDGAGQDFDRAAGVVVELLERPDRRETKPVRLLVSFVENDEVNGDRREILGAAGERSHPALRESGGGVLLARSPRNGSVEAFDDVLIQPEALVESFQSAFQAAAVVIPVRFEAALRIEARHFQSYAEGPGFRLETRLVDKAQQLNLVMERASALVWVEDTRHWLLNELSRRVVRLFVPEVRKDAEDAGLPFRDPEDEPPVREKEGGRVEKPGPPLKENERDHTARNAGLALDAERGGQAVERAVLEGDFHQMTVWM